MKQASNNTKEKRLRRNFGIAPREARLILKSSSYDYRLAENVLYQNGFKKLNLSTSELCKAVKEFGKLVERFISAFATFSERLKGVAENDTPS
jgi:hypothetical protein